MKLGRLESVDLREIWSSEAGDFTPWLAQDKNLHLLGEAIDCVLELEAQEKKVGPFRADLLCRETSSDHWVVIENQLERTDHSHLGQLLTYSAGLKAVTIVWIAQKFTEEHRAALDWLNEITDSRFNFFGLEVELWRISGSAVAPKFNIVSKPNDWTKNIARDPSARNLTDSKLLQREFWTGFRSYADKNSSVIRPTKALPQSWMNISIGRTGAKLAAVASMWDTKAESYASHEIRSELVLDGAESKTFFGELNARREEFEESLGEALEWHNPESKRVCRIYLRRSVDLHDRDRWADYHDWLLKKLEEMYRVFRPVVLTLGKSEGAGGND